MVCVYFLPCCGWPFYSFFLCGLFKNIYILPMSTRCCSIPGICFYVWCEMGVKMYFFSCGYSVDPASFIQRTAVWIQVFKIRWQNIMWFLDCLFHWVLWSIFALTLQSYHSCMVSLHTWQCVFQLCFSSLQLPWLFEFSQKFKVHLVHLHIHTYAHTTMLGLWLWL